jgi:hypothetical protein
MAAVALDHLLARGLVGTHDLAQVLWVQPTGKGGGLHQIAEHHRQLPPFGVCRTQCNWCRGDRRRLIGLSGAKLPGLGREGYCGWVCTTGPDQDSAVLIDRQALRLDNFSLQICEVGIVKTELPLERPVGDAPAASEHLERLIQHLLECHSWASICGMSPHVDGVRAWASLIYAILYCIW